MNTTEFLTERATDVVYHYTGINSALGILSSGEFKLAGTGGTEAEQQYAPPGYPYFLSLSRSKVGDYHRYVGSGGVMFVLDGQWLSDRYPVKPVDYWYSGKTPATLKRGEWATIDPGSKKSMWQYSPERSSESEDRVFSKQNTIPIDPIKEVHVYIKEPDERRSPWTRKVMLEAKRRGIKTYLYSDVDAWRTQNKRKALVADQMARLLKGPEPETYYRRPARGAADYGKSKLMDWIELIKKQPGQPLSKSADKLAYDIRYYGDQVSQFKNELHNARKPDASDYDFAVKITNYMVKNKLDANALVAALKTKWSVK